MQPEKGENAAAESVRREMSPIEPWAEGADGFLPWEAEVNARIRAQFAAEAPTAYEDESADLGSDPFLREPAPVFGSEDAVSIPSDFRATGESVTDTANAAFLEESLEPSAHFSESPFFAAETTERGLLGSGFNRNLRPFGARPAATGGRDSMPADSGSRARLKAGRPYPRSRHEAVKASR